MWVSYIRSFGTIRPLTVGIGLGAAAAIFLIRKFAPRIPGAVVGVLAATLVCHFFSLEVETIGARFGAIPRVLPLPAFPRFSWDLFRMVLPDSFTIALLAAIESLLSAVVADGMGGTGTMPIWNWPPRGREISPGPFLGASPPPAP
jgi:SulP family sulfate permease